MLIDVSHAVEHGMVTYTRPARPARLRLPQPRGVAEACTPRAPSSTSARSRWSPTPAPTSTPRSTATPTATTSPELPLDRSPTCRASWFESEGRAIDPSGVRRAATCAARRCWSAPGWDAHWRTDQYFEGHPFLTADAAEYLADAGAALVGIDSLNIDDTADLTRPVHSTLLRAGIPIVEHLTRLDRLPEAGFRFFAVPVKVKGMGTFPVRAFGVT